MLRKIKNYLGIESVKIQILVEEGIDFKTVQISGLIRLTSQSDQRVERIYLRIIEKYRRGRGDALLINEYILGEKCIELNKSIQKGTSEDIPFTMTYDQLKSEMDTIQDESWVGKPLAWLAKKLKNVKSEYRIEASADIKGTRLKPIDTSTLKLI